MEAARKALAAAGRTPEDVDLIIVATTTPDLTFPATAAIVQSKLGAPMGIAFDVQAVCSGFVYGLGVADGFVARGHSKCGLVIGSETMTRLLDWTDRSTCVLFGDGAGAAVVEPVSRPRDHGGPGPALLRPALRRRPSRGCSMWTAGRPPPARSASCGCRATRCSATRW